jgi:monooxygenase
VVVVGSGATAITLVPAMATKAAHVTMVQRSPTYVASLPRTDPHTARLAKVLPALLLPRVSRWRSVLFTQGFYLFCRRRPEAARRFLTTAAASQLPAGYPLDPNFSPTYNPWDQRMCLVPDGDLFESITAGTSSIVTGRIETFTGTGIRLTSGEEIRADLVVLATGLQLVAWGGITLSVDDTVVDPGTTFVYRGCMLSDVPNLAFCVGYVNASWTLRADLSSRYVCRLLNHMAAHSYVKAVPRHVGQEEGVTPVFALKSGYVERAAAFLPKQGARAPWRFHQNYPLDFLLSRTSSVTTSMDFARAADQNGLPADLGT